MYCSHDPTSVNPCMKYFSATMANFLNLAEIITDALLLHISYFVNLNHCIAPQSVRLAVGCVLFCC